MFLLVGVWCILFSSMLMKYRFGLMVIIMFGLSWCVMCRNGWLLGWVIVLLWLFFVKLVILWICRLIEWFRLCGKNVCVMLFFIVFFVFMWISLCVCSILVSWWCVCMCSCV